MVALLYVLTSLNLEQKFVLVELADIGVTVVEVPVQTQHNQ